jgi:predicted AAA+ superfamily ATPase
LRDIDPQEIMTLDLLLPETEDHFARNPQRLKSEALAHKEARPLQWVFIDEVQKVPRLLDVVHHLIEEEKIKFILTGSSARKLKRGSANLLAGRAFVYPLFPLTSVELGTTFDLARALHWGTLPKIIQTEQDSDKTAYLRA